jgi:hypothetical protein
VLVVTWCGLWCGLWIGIWNWGATHRTRSECVLRVVLRVWAVGSGVGRVIVCALGWALVLVSAVALWNWGCNQQNQKRCSARVGCRPWCWSWHGGALVWALDWFLQLALWDWWCNVCPESASHPNTSTFVRWLRIRHVTLSRLHDSKRDFPRESEDKHHILSCMAPPEAA